MFSLIGVLGSVTLFVLSVKSDQPFFYIIKTYWGITLILVALSCLLISLLFLYLTTKVVATYSGMAEEALLGGIAQYDADHKDCSVKGHNYRRYLSEHIWKGYRAAYIRNERKADLLSHAQNYLFGALFLIVVFLIGAVLHIFNMPDDAKTKSSETIIAPAAPAPTRPAPLMTSPEPAKVTNSDRPAPLPLSPQGQSEQRSLDRPAPLKPSPMPGKISESKDKK